MCFLILIRRMDPLLKIVHTLYVYVNAVYRRSLVANSSLVNHLNEIVFKRDSNKTDYILLNNSFCEKLKIRFIAWRN